MYTMRIGAKWFTLAAGLVLSFVACTVVAEPETTGLKVEGKLLVATDTADVSTPADSFLAVDEMPEMVYQASPVYPQEEKSKGVQADVWVKALVGRSGSVLKAETLKSDGVAQSFQKAALDAALKNSFKPAVAKGKPVAVWVTYQVRFVLADKNTAPSSPPKGK